MAVAATVLAVAGTALSVVQARSTAKAEQKQLQYQQQVAQNNAIIAEDNRKQAIFEATVTAADKDLTASAFLGDAIAAAGASGLSLAAGSKAAQRISARKVAARDRARIISEGLLEGGRFAQQRTGFETRGQNLASAERGSRSAGRLNIVSSLVSGASKVAGTFPKPKIVT